MNKMKLVRISLLIFFGILTAIGFSLLSLTIFNSLGQENSSQLMSKIIIYTSISILASFSFSLVKAWNNALEAISKSILSISTLILGIVILIFTLSSHSQDITSAIQPTIDEVVIEYISNQTNPTQEIEIVQELIENPQEITKVNAEEITVTQAEKLINSLNLSSQKPIEVSQILITVIDEYISTNQPQFDNSPLPISIISKEIENFSELPVDQLPLFLSYDPNATLFILYPLNSSENISQNNLAILRNECQTIPENLLCEQLESTTYSSLITTTFSNEKQINKETLEQINSTQKLQEFIVSKTNTLKLLVLLVILGIVFAVILKEINEKINKKEPKTIEITFFISQKLSIAMIFPTVMLIITYLFLTSQKLETMLQEIISNSLQENFSISFQQLPLFLEFKELLQTIMTTYIIILTGILITAIISYYFLRKNKEKEKETKINHF